MFGWYKNKGVYVDTVKNGHSHFFLHFVLINLWLNEYRRKKRAGASSELTKNVGGLCLLSDLNLELSFFYSQESVNT